MWLTAEEEDGAFWSYPDVAELLGLAIPCLARRAMLAKVAVMALAAGNTHKGLELLPGQLLGYAMLYAALALLLKTEYGRPFWRSLGWRWPRSPIHTLAASGMALAFAIGILGAALKT